MLQRILRETGAHDLFDTLTRRISPTDLQSLLLFVCKQRAETLRPNDVLQQYKSNLFVRPTSEPPLDLLKMDELAFSLLPGGFRTIELSPVAPFGACTALAPLDQNNILSTVRNTEVVSDTTNVLALECAVRRSGDSASSLQTKLCASHRLLRTQRFADAASFPHFRLLALCTAGRNHGNLDQEFHAVEEHIDFFIRLLRASERLGYHARGIRVTLMPFSTSHFTAAQVQVRDVLLTKHTDITFDVGIKPDMSKGYYQHFRYQIHANDGHEDLLLVDGGLTPWTKVLLNNKKEFFLTSGLGTERFVAFFRSR